MRPAPLALYVHWPFCLAKCPYCDFNSHVRHQPPDQARYIAAFRREIAHRAALAPGRTVSSIFFGGGTPSLMEGATVGAILDAIGEHWAVDPPRSTASRSACRRWTSRRCASSAARMTCAKGSRRSMPRSAASSG